MKKILIALVIALTLIINVQAKTATKITETKFINNQITIIGTGEGEVQIVLFDLKNMPLYMTTVTTKDGKFEITLPQIADLKEGTYKVKASDYDGKNITTSEVVVKEPEVPQTIDNIILYIILGSISLIGMIIAGLYIIKKKPKSKR